MSVNIKENGQLVKTAGLNSQTVIIDNLTTQDATKALSAKQGYVLNQIKVDKVNGKDLSTNDYTNEEKTKLAGITAGAEPNVQSDWKQSDSSSDDFIKNKPTSEIQTSDDGQFTTVTGGLMQSCVVDLEPIQSGSGTPSPSNVRAISGHTQVQVGNCGKNKCNPDTFVQGLLNYNTGEVNSSVLQWITSDFIPANGTVTLSGYADGTERNFCVRLCEYDANKTFIKNTMNPNTTGDATWSRTITLDSNTKYVRTSVGFNNKATTLSTYFATNRLQIEDGSQATDYEPFNGYTTTINLGGTYYGGTLDAVSGELTVDRSYWDLASLDWTRRADIGSGVFQCSNLGFVYSKDTTKQNICSCYDYNGIITAGGYSNVNGKFSLLSSSDYLFICDNNYSDATAFKNSLTGQKLVVYLATPQTIQLDPQTLETLVGINDVFAPLEGQSVEEVEFREVLAWDDVPKAIPYECVDPIEVDGFTVFKIHKYGRVVVLKFDDLEYPPVASEDGWVTLGKLPERFYHKYPNPTVAQNMNFGVINDDNGTLQMKQLTVEQYGGNVRIYFLANEAIHPLGSITYILDHD